MDSGLEKAKFFFFFVSENSLQSNMVKLEWQNALMRSTRMQLRFIPVRIDSSSMPTILTQTLYIDLYTNGFEIALSQMVQVVKGVNTFSPTHSGYSNLRSSLRWSESSLFITVFAQHYLEVVPRIAVVFGNPANNVEVHQVGVAMEMSYDGTIPTNDGRTANLRAIGLQLPLTPEFPVEIEVKTTNGSILEYMGVLRETSTNSWKPIPN
jgi:hypothetical protein